MPSRDQSIVFFTNAGWTPRTSEYWLYQHNLQPIKPADRSLRGQLHYRLEDPKHFNRFRTIKTSDGINIIIGFPKPGWA